MSVLLKNSVIVTTGSLIIVVISASLAAYAFCRLKFYLKNIFYWLILTSLMLPIHVALVPLFQIMKKFHILNTYFSLMLPYVAFGLPLTMFILKNYLDTIPVEIEDAAKIDGCSSLGIYWRICLPLLKPALATVIVFQFMMSWNEFVLALLFMTRPFMKTLPLAPLIYQSATGSQSWEKIFAVLSMMSVPIMVLYIILQKYFVKALTAGALKG